MNAIEEPEQARSSKRYRVAIQMIDGNFITLFTNNFTHISGEIFLEEGLLYTTGGSKHGAIPCKRYWIKELHP